MFGFGYFSPVSEALSEEPQAIPGVNAPVDQREGEPTTDLGQRDQSIGDFVSGVLNEGLGGTADRQGMMDRSDARRDLAKKFEIVGDKDARLGNQVTQAEYNDIARTYSDIRLGRNDLKIDAEGRPDPQQFRADMMDDIGDIMQTRSGRQLIGSLANNVRQDEDGNSVHRTTTLQAHLDDKTKQLDLTNASEVGDTSKGVGSPYPDGSPGVGGDATVKLNPNMDVLTNGKSEFRSDVALYHELVHAHHDTQGDDDMSDVTMLDGVLREAGQLNPLGMMGMMRELADTTELNGDADEGVSRVEHQAVGLGLYANDPLTENVYRRERNEVAWSGKGIGGDLLMPQRERYAKSGTWYQPFFGY